jgi:drug/metabolite transporter superfamily protein YnfA
LAPLALAPLGIAASWGEPFARRLAIFAGFLTLAWFATMQESRYLIHACVIGAIFAVIGWRYAESLIGRRGALLGAIVVAISLSYGLIEILAATRSNMRSVVSASYAADRRSAEIPFVSSFDYLNRNPDVTRLLILDPSITPYYSDKDYLKPFGQWGEHVLPDAKTPSDVLARLDQLHISHILDVRSNASSFRVPPNFPGLVLVFDQPNQRVYAVQHARN